MRREVPRFKPDLVILSVFVDNDVSGCSPILNVDGNSSEAPFVILQEDGTLKIDLSLPQASYDDFQREPKYTLRKWLGLYRQLYALKVQLAARAAGRDADDYIPPRYRLYQDPSPEVWDGAWRVFERMVLEFVAEANRLGVPVVIFSVPTPQVVNVASWTALEEKFPAMRKLKWDVAGPEQRLARLAQRNKLELIQPYRLFVDAPKDPELYFKGIGHPTVRGHQLIATAITDHLRKRNGWVD